MSCQSRFEWFSMLAKLAYPANPGRAEEALMPMLARFSDLPEHAFTDESLEHVITSPRRMAIPSYDEIRKPLAAWWWERKRTADQRLGRDEWPALPAPAAIVDAAPADARERVAAAMAIFRRNIAEVKATRPPERPIKLDPGHLSDADLLVTCEAMAAQGNGPAAIRAAGLRAKMGKEHADER